MPRKFILFAVVAVVQLGVLASMIFGNERVLEEGEAFRFRTAPIDPRDPFRGEYVALEFAEESRDIPYLEEPLHVGQTVFATITQPEGGEALITAISMDRPTGEVPYLTCTVDWSPYTDSAVTRVSFPFDRYYLEEGDGPKTEKLIAPQWNEGVPQEALPAHAIVRILEGEAVIQDLVVGDRSIHEWLKEPPVAAPVQQTTPTPTSGSTGS